MSHFGDGKNFGIKVQYIIEDKLMGTAGGIAAIDISSSKEFLITNADVLTDANYRNILQSYKEKQSRHAGISY